MQGMVQLFKNMRRAVACHSNEKDLPGVEPAAAASEYEYTDEKKNADKAKKFDGDNLTERIEWNIPHSQNQQEHGNEAVIDSEDDVAQIPAERKLRHRR